MSAQRRRDIRQYLRKPNELFRRVRDEHGQLHLSKRAAAYHPGQGVYRSSYKNARRLTATETNMAYETSDYERWQQLDFVVGIEVKLSGNHTCLGGDGKPHEFKDICDELAGKYPKTFKFTGWHPQCRCIAISILKTQEEMDVDTQKILNGEPLDGESVNKVTDVPQAFMDWCAENSDRIDRAAERGTLPYFLRDNRCYMDKALSQPKQPTILERAAARHAARTPEQVEAIKHRWEKRQEYISYLNDPDYNDVRFDYDKGVVTATHKEHKTHPNDNQRYFNNTLTGDDLENEFKDYAFGKGHSVIMRKENDNEVDLDMYLDDKLMDLVSVTSNSNTFAWQIKRKNIQLRSYNEEHNENNGAICMYFHDASYYSESKIHDGIAKLRRLGYNIVIREVYVMLNDGTDMIKVVVQ